ncbi:S-adenosyl-L-methionine-dependent methyltransferase [Annulohypoxylon maeteangense]|uniref:S-adenosyl-L-methionine-dependent methyltransferase n=1 Tax=Annulohypoxylon maeteangense TaxID=1927788 RepID=UPI002008C68A|nr:S-adenosyl-L-methionine-dependent methyltransferase [Annulohypoxylon maeteangense]KAI0889361.1 S-adenosyl-L-methionine-dependent methyltransferase [Annulohypoxylon maeteangense]
MGDPENLPSTSIRYLSTTEAYDRWAAVYDTDGNFLQALDTIELKTLFPQFLRLLKSPEPWRIVDLGCGTGRNTALLLTVPDIEEVIALDSSRGMLEVARSRLNEANDRISIPSREPAGETPKLHLQVFDMIMSPSPPKSAQQADGVVSTLVAEHVPLPTFFSQVSQILRPGGLLLLTNMHAHMGGISQAGFVDAETGEKIRPISYAHTVADVVAEARRWGLEVMEMGDGYETGIKEIRVNETMVEKLGPRSRKWVGVTCWFGGLFSKSENQ